MLAAAGYAALAASALLAGALIVYALSPSHRLIAVVMALGSGLLIGSVAYDLVGDVQGDLPVTAMAVSLMAGAGTFVLGSRMIERKGGRRRKSPAGAAVSDGDQPLSIVLGSALDGVPESFVLGLSVVSGGVSIPLLLGISLSNLPEGMAASSGLRAQGWPLKRVAGLWAAVILTSAVSGALGHAILADDDGTLTGIVQTFAAGALLAMIADTMVPESYEVEREWTGALVVAGFALSLLLASALG
jgi:ZIP family zinc transporter